MRVIRPAVPNRRPAALLALGLVVAGAVALTLVLTAHRPSTAFAGTLAMVAAVGLGVGGAWLARVIVAMRSRSAADLLERLLAPAFDDSYTLVLRPRLPIRDAHRLDGLLIGPAGVRALTVRDWEGRYRVRGRRWEFDSGGRNGWIPCRTNPGFDAAALADGVNRWAAGVGLMNTTARGVAVFPLGRSRVVLEEPEDEIVTSANGPWWANAIGRRRHLDPAASARLLAEVLDASETDPFAPGRDTASIHA